MPVASTFETLHHVLQAAFSWENHHLYEFEVDDLTIAPHDPEDPNSAGRQSAEFTRLKDTVVPEERFIYRYDFGDDWVHLIEVQARQAPDPSALYPFCLAGVRAAPPEDFGGPEAYREMLEMLADPRHPEHRQTRRWSGKDFDPERFDRRSVNALLRSFGKSRGRRAPFV